MWFVASDWNDGWRGILEVQVEMNPRKKPYVIVMGKLLKWPKKMNVTEYMKAEWSPPCSIANIERTGDIFGDIQNFDCMED